MNCDEQRQIDDTIDALQTELDSALGHLTAPLSQSRRGDEIAWWLCANHPRFVLDNPTRRPVLQPLAERAGLPPKGKNWDSWFTRVRRR